MARVVPQFSWLSKFSRPILVRGNDVKVLFSPDEFYGALLVSLPHRRSACGVFRKPLGICRKYSLSITAVQEGVQTAKRRVVLSSLYLGTGEKAEGLVCPAHMHAMHAHMNTAYVMHTSTHTHNE